MHYLEESSRYRNNVAKFVDSVSHFMMGPWISILSNLMSCYISTVQDEMQPQYKLLEYCLLGPLYILALICLAPVGLFGIMLWILLCVSCSQDKFTYVKVHTFEKDKDSESHSSHYPKTNTFTFATANVLLAPEFLGRLNNVKWTYRRTFEIAKRIINHSGKPLCNMKLLSKSYDLKNKHHSVMVEFPYIDFLCLQEVWERSTALVLIGYLKDEFSYFLCDVGEFSWNVNLCMIGSGLMFASKRTILEADFKAFTYRTKHARYAAQGVLCVKVLLYYNGPFRHVGFITNLHTQAFQEHEAVIPSQLSEVKIFLNEFKKQYIQNTDVVDFDVICGDFNADNMSPADQEVQHHSLFSEYEDICIVKPGEDEEWTIGTELRQMMMYKAPLQDPFTFKDVLVDDSLRRLYLLDADVLIHGRHLVTQTLIPDKDGKVSEVKCGGKRRIDKIIYSKSHQVEVLGYCFVTALTNLTDHLPVCLTLKTSWIE